jgi:hypothetical protein
MWTRQQLKQVLSVAAAVAGTLVLGSARADDRPFLPRVINSSTIPANGDVNPYGVAIVPEGFPSGGTISSGDALASNFNNSANLQGAGTTIVQLTPTGALAPPGTATVFYTSSLQGLSTALGVLKRGFVVVGNVPTTDGTFATIGAGALQVIDRNGNWLATWTDPVFLNGPWDLALHDEGATAHLYVSNVLSGTVSRLDLAVSSSGVTITQKTTIANGYSVAPNAAAVVLGPTGLAYDESTDTLYVASTSDNAIYSVSHASHRSSPEHRGSVVFRSSHLRGPLALRMAPNGNLLTANGDAVNADVLHPSEIVEFTKWGQYVREYDVDSSQGGAFGLDVRASGDGFDYAVIDDVTNTFTITHLPVR